MSINIKSTELRKLWIEFFVKNKHVFIPSKSLIPENDDSILWINSGVATLKEYFTGLKKPPSKSLVNYQKCIRTNDIEQVGMTARHHTFFEMLGNFSIGGYFKKEAINLASMFLFNELKFEKKDIYITYFHEDMETKQLWLDQGIDESHIISGSKKTNFWDIGSGPCGPNTEIFFDRGSRYDPNNKGILLLENDIENDRYIEIWNIVFSQFNNDGNNNYTPLEQKNIDTGAGFERLLSILQDVPTNYDTDLFIPIIKHIEQISGQQYKIENYFINNPKQKTINSYFRIIVDHIRAASYAINDGAAPSNVGRGYIIRRLIRRAYRTGIQLGINDKSFLYKLVLDVSASLPIYELDIDRVTKVIKIEEEKFAKTINLGEKLFKKALINKKINEEIVFKLFETYGFPMELTEELAKENGITFDKNKLALLFKKHQSKSKSMVNKGMKQQYSSLQKIKENYTKFVGYEKEKINSEILYLFNEHEIKDSINNIGMLIAKETPFYATKGGQAHDIGIISQGNNLAKVIDVFLDKEQNHIHVIKMEKGILKKGKAYFEVEHNIRKQLKQNHSATHLLYAALRKVLGIGIFQLGSDNNQNRLKFDFPLDHLLTNDEIDKVEKQVTKYINAAIKREYIVTTYQKAKAMKALGLPKSTIRGEVRVVKFGDFSIELCGGTHVDNTIDIEKFLIIKVESKGSGIYRIEALTSKNTIKKYFLHKKEELENKLFGLIKKIKQIDPSYKNNITIADIESKEQIKIENEKVELLLSEFKKIRNNINKQNIAKIVIKPKKIHNINLFIDFKNINFQNLKATSLDYRDKNPKAIIVLGIKKGDQLILMISSKKYDSNKILQQLFSLHKGRGGGNKISAQGSCKYEDTIKKDIEDIINGL